MNSLNLASDDGFIDKPGSDADLPGAVPEPPPPPPPPAPMPFGGASADSAIDADTVVEKPGPDGGTPG